MNRHWAVVFPRRWREQYGEDMAVNLAHTRLGLRAILDVVPPAEQTPTRRGSVVARGKP
jgi:hypothetical protein